MGARGRTRRAVRVAPRNAPVRPAFRAPGDSDDPRHGPARPARDRHDPHPRRSTASSRRTPGTRARRWAWRRWRTRSGRGILRHAPTHPDWPDRDRFVLSAGHASMLLYSLLHLTGYDVSLDDLKAFRQWGSITPGHPEYGLTPGVEATTGPLGQGFTNAVGMAIAERRLAAEFNRAGHEIVDHRTYVICSRRRPPGGHRVRGRARSPATCGWASSSSSTTTTTSSSTARRRWPSPRTSARASRRTAGTSSASRTATTSTRSTPRSRRPRPTTARRSSPSAPHRLRQPEQAGQRRRRTARRSAPTRSASPRRPTAGIRTGRSSSRTRRRELFRRAVPARRGARRRLGGRARRATPRRTRPRPPSSRRRVAGRLPDGWDAGLPAYATGTEVATRNASQEAIQALAATLPELFGGSADLSESNLTDVKGDGHDTSTPTHAGRNLRFGVREHAMGGIANGIALPRRRSSRTARRSSRSATTCAAPSGSPRSSGLHVIYVWTHDSVGLGEDGPTHQPVEHYAALRAIPNLWFVRPGDANETAAAWALAVERPTIAGASAGPVALALTRQKLPTLAGTPELAREGVRRGGYVLREAAAGTPQLILIGTGSELQLCVARRRGARGRRHPDAGRVPPLLGAVRGPGPGLPRRASCRRPSASACRSRPASRSAGSAGSATRGRSSGSTTSARPRPPGRSSRSSGSRPTASRTSADASSATGCTAAAGRSPTPHGDHPTLEPGDAGVDRTPTSDPGR